MTDLPFCTRCSRPSIAVYECADGSTACLGCIAKALDYAVRESERQWQVRDFLRRVSRIEREVEG